MKKIVHIVGTGTIGEPLIGLFTDFRKYLGIDEVTFHKRTPMTTERAKVNHLLERGAQLALDRALAGLARPAAKAAAVVGDRQLETHVRRS